jgi:hypothetical protein
LTPNVDAGLIVAVAAEAAGAPVMVSTIAGPTAKATNFTYLRLMANHPPLSGNDCDRSFGNKMENLFAAVAMLASAIPFVQYPAQIVQ